MELHIDKCPYKQMVGSPKYLVYISQLDYNFMFL